jgi:hypothetical protein
MREVLAAFFDVGVGGHSVESLHESETLQCCQSGAAFEFSIWFFDVHHIMLKLSGTSNPKHEGLLSMLTLLSAGSTEQPRGS